MSLVASTASTSTVVVVRLWLLQGLLLEYHEGLVGGLPLRLHLVERGLVLPLEVLEVYGLTRVRILRRIRQIVLLLLHH